MARKIPDSGSLGIEAQTWLDALNAASKRNDAGMTSAEFAQVWGLSTKTAVDRIRHMHRLGWVTVGQRDEISIAGRRCVVPVYTVKAPPKAKKK